MAALTHGLAANSGAAEPGQGKPRPLQGPGRPIPPQPPTPVLASENTRASHDPFSPGCGRR